MTTKRVWEDFLTEQDKAHLEILGPKKRKEAFGNKPAILNIDNYRSVAGDEPMDILEMIKTWPGAMGYAAWEALDNIADLLAAARAAGIPAAHVHGLPVEESGVDHGEVVQVLRTVHVECHLKLGRSRHSAPSVLGAVR